MTVSAPCYFAAPDGITYRVLDTRTYKGRRIAADPTDPPLAWATTRVFRAADGRERFLSLATIERHPEWRGQSMDELLAECFARSERGRGWPVRTLAEREAEARSASMPPRA